MLLVFQKSFAKHGKIDDGRVQALRPLGHADPHLTANALVEIAIVDVSVFREATAVNQCKPLAVIASLNDILDGTGDNSLFIIQAHVLEPNARGANLIGGTKIVGKSWLLIIVRRLPPGDRAFVRRINGLSCRKCRA